MLIGSGRFWVGGPEARLKRGAFWWCHHNQPTVIITFDLLKIRLPKGMFLTLRHDWNSRRRKCKGCSWYTTLKTLKAGKTRLATHKSWAIASWHRPHFFILATHFSAFTINKLQSLPLWKFHTSPFEQMIDSWYPEFVHIHVFVGIHETIKKQPRRFETLNLF